MKTRYSFTFWLLIVGCLLHPIKTIAQTKSSSRESEIKAYIKYIDQLSAEQNKTAFKQIITKGNIEQTKTVTELTNATSQITHVVGKFVKTIVTDPTGKQLYKVDYHDNDDHNFYETYYYQNNKLIAAIEVLKDEDNRTVLFDKEEFYQNGMALFTSKTSGILPGKNVKRTAIPLPEQGNNYLKQYLSTGK